MFMKNKKFICRIMIVLVMFTMLFESSMTNVSAAGRKEINSYFSKSAFIGNSVGLGQKMYFDSKGKNFLGAPLMLVKGCYSFANDKSSTSSYRISYKGKLCKASDAVKQSKVKRVFINMGINDIGMGAEKTYDEYVAYIRQIKKKSPKVVIFIESTTPVYVSGQVGNLNNKSINKLNKKMKKYCEQNKDMYFIDVNTILKDKNGGLKKEYTSDNYVHMTMKGYEVWTDEVVSYVKKLLTGEEKAKAAVIKAGKTHSDKDYLKAVKKVNSLCKSTKKTELKLKLKKIKQKNKIIEKKKEQQRLIEQKIREEELREKNLQEKNEKEKTEKEKQNVAE